ncbi:MAG: hypothetical protein H6734_07470 [Alphaproteobacteria bacterium]|nr:hypothetical protein [Alphaproteobacteria bacterium]
MEDDLRDSLLTGLTADDPRTRAVTAGRVRQVDLDDLRVLEAMLDVAADTRPLPDDMQPAEPEDPFAAFFGASGSKKPSKTVGEAACDRLVFTGVIGRPETVGCLAAALDREGCPEPLVRAVVKVLGETQWTDRVDAVRQLVPRLHGHDAALYAVIVRFGDTEHRLMVGSALSPYRSRAVNELLNHGASKPMMEEALGDGIVSGRLELDEVQAADALTLLVSWSSPWAGRVAAALHDRFPWTLLVLGMADARSGAALDAWLASDPPAPLGLVRKLQEVLKASPDLPHFPLAAWIRYAGTGIDVVRQWGAAARCQAELEAFVRAWPDDPERAWDALAALAEAGLHASVAGSAVDSLGHDDESALWTRDRIEALATARPSVPGLVDAAAGVLERHPELTRVFVPALMRGVAAADLAGLADRYIALCESRPVIRKPSRRGLVHEEREGVDPVPLQPLVNALDDAALTARLQDVLPYVRAEG